MNLRWDVGRARTRGRALTQGLEDAGSFPGGADRLEVRRQGPVVAQDGQGAPGLQAGAELPLSLQVTQFLHGFQLDLEALVLGRGGEQGEMVGYQSLDWDTGVPQTPQVFPILREISGHT